MQFQALFLACAAALVAGQQSEIDFAGDVPPECAFDQACEKAIRITSQCPRNLNVPFTADQQYLSCLCPNPQFSGNIAQCYSCVGQYKREGDIKKIYNVCTTYNAGGMGFMA